MTYPALVALACLLGAGDAKPKPTPAAETLADEVKLRSGKSLLGEVLERPKSGELVMIIRRVWAEKNVPDLAKRWKETEAATNRKAVAAYRIRLEAWKRDRTTLNVRDDRLSAWIDVELARLDKRGDEPTPLLVVRIRSNDIKSVTKRGAESTRLLRLAWKCKFDDPEASKPAELKESLEFRGLKPKSEDAVTIDELLPIVGETDDHWLLRRAATEVAYDNASCFREMGNTLVVDPFAGNGNFQTFSMPNMNLPRLSTEEQLRSLVARGRVGAAVTRQATNPGMDTAGAEIILWVRSSRGGWRAVDSSTAVIKAVSLSPEELQGAQPNFVPQVSFAFTQSFQSGFGGPVNSQSVQSHPHLGAASSKALNQAREAFLKKLVALKVPVES